MFPQGDGTPLHFAVESGREEIVKLLIEKGADVNAKNWVSYCIM